jgi:uncharacterized protein YdaU (DUF1376 family)
MRFYPFHIGDYHLATSHLSLEEDLCLRRLLDLYYSTEQAIPLDTERVARRIQVGSELVSRLLREFFNEESDGWHNARCDKEIATFLVRAETARTNGRLGGRPKTTTPKPAGYPKQSRSNATHDPSPITPIPIVHDGGHHAQRRQSVIAELVGTERDS